MLKYFNYDIVFQEIPSEITLAVNLSLCPNRCKGCHSPWLWTDEGEILDKNAVDNLISLYDDEITCFAIMGGDNSPKEVNDLCKYIKEIYPTIKVAWYSGKDEIAKEIEIQNFDYIKIGAYKEEFGSLKSRTTNQRLYKINSNSELEDITQKFWR